MTIGSILTVPGVRPVVELGVGNTNATTGQAVWDTARWDTAGDKWAGNEPTWLDITCDVHDVEIDQGRDRSIARWQVGTASITLDNTTGRYDLAADPVSPAVLNIRPGRQVRAGVALDGGPVTWLGRWFIDAATPTYDPVLQDVVTLDCVDAKGQAGKVELGEIPPAGGSETVTARINRVLDAAGSLAAYRSIQASSITLQATTLGAAAVDLCDVAADSAGGALFGDATGKVVYKSRDWQLYQPDVPPDGTIGNLPATGDDVVWTAPAAPPTPADVLVEPFNDFTANGWVNTSGTIVAGRTGNGAQFGTGSSSATYTIPVPSQSAYLTIGFAWKVSLLTNPTGVFQLRNAAGATVQSRLNVLTTGALQFCRGGATGIVNTAGGVIAINTWYYIEVQVRLADSPNGTVIVRVNGTEVINSATLDTYNGGTSTVYESVELIRPGVGASAIYDDMYLSTGVDAVFHGDVTIPPYPPAPPVGGGETVDVVYNTDQLVWMGGGTGGAVCPSGWEMSFESADMATRVLVGRPSEPPHIFDDVTAQTLYGVETFTRTDLICAVPADLDVLGARMLAVLSAGFLPNVAAVTIDAATSLEARDLAATVDPTKPSRFRGYLREGGRVVFDRQFLAVGVAHRIDPESWTVRIALDDAGPFAIVGNRWDDAAWSSGTWAEPATALIAEARELIGAANG